MMKKLFLLASYCLIFSGLSAQIVWTEPAFPTQDDEVILYYDATQGNGGLVGTTPVYIHTGVITSLSPTPTSWQHVQGNWGQADANVLMSPLGNNLHSFDFSGQTLAEFYGLQPDETIEALAMVFRNQNGSAEGKTEDGGDIFYSLTDGSFTVQFISPAEESIILEVDESVNINAQCSSSADLSLSVDGNEEASALAATSLEYTFTPTESGTYNITISADNGTETASDTFEVVVLGNQNVAASPAGVEDGINYIDDNTVVLQLFAPNKENIFVIGDFNNWNFDADYLMNLDTDGETFWLEIGGLTPGQEYRFQYYISSDNMRIADPYSEKILDPWNDQWISDDTYPNLIEYPSGSTTMPVTVLETGQTEFNWTDENYVRPEEEKLVIYETLLRDFIAAHNYATLTDSLDYLDNLGVNAIQLMPVNEFEGNESWGYNPSFFFAADKYYGPSDSYKAFVNECHNRGIAVIMDIALNHSFGQNPQVRMYFDANIGPFGEPTAENPWFNQTPRHDFNVGYDYNHESPHTRAFCKRVLEHWVEEFHIDGYRMDLSKGFTQNNTLGNIGAWNAYDQSRVDILNDYKNHLWSVEPGAYMILEHFADNGEETALANQGFMLWGNINHEYNEATMGYNSDLSWGSYQTRGWNDPHLISYMESHDEERLMYKNLLYGNSANGYDITQMNTALARMELASCFLYPIPGPKMLWQFGELGYDFSINYCTDGSINENCRTGNKPIRWDYFDEAARRRVYNVTAALNHLKTTEPAFSTTDFNIDLGGFGKRIHLNHSSMNVTIIGNFDVVGINMVPGFQNTGTWYDYFTGEEIQVTDLNNAFFLEPGEYRLYTTVPLETPVIDLGIDEEATTAQVAIYPNPAQDESTIDLSRSNWNVQDISIEVFDMRGQRVSEQIETDQVSSSSIRLTELDRLTPGMYIVALQGKNETLRRTIIVQGK